MISIFIIGSGNVAHALARAFAKQIGAKKANNIELAGIYSRNTEEGAKLANELNCNFCEAIENVPKDCDVYIFAVSDDAIEDLSNKFNTEGLVVHCAGMLGMDVLSKHHKNCGVLWPLQSMSKETESDFIHTPLFLEASDEKNGSILKSVAASISHSVHFINSKQRQYFHLAAVLSNNFGNHLFALSEKMLKEHGLDFELMKPIILQTAQKIMDAQPADVQTGPAIRHDDMTIKKHLALLKKDENLRNLYKIFTESIQTLKAGNQ